MSSAYLVLPFVVARIKNSKDHVLIGQLPNLQRKPYPALWDLPGGKLEAGESPEDGIKRELKEELGVEVAKCKLADVFHHTKGTIRKDCTNQIPGIGLCFDVETRGKLAPTEQTNVHFVTPSELKKLPMTPWTEYFLRNFLV